MSIKNRWNVLTAKLRGWREKHPSSVVQSAVDRWANGVFLIVLSGLLVAAEYAAVRIAFLTGDPWTLAALSLLVVVMALVLKILAR